MSENPSTLADAGGDETDRAKLLKAHEPYRLIGNQLFEQLHEEVYADL